MFDVGFSELILLAVVALVVLGPEKLPHAARILGAWMGKIRRTVSQMQTEIEREVAMQEMKARMEKEFGQAGGQKLLAELQEEQQKMDAELKNMTVAATAAISTASDAASSTPVIAATTPAAEKVPSTEPTPLQTAVDAPPPPVLPEAVQSPDSVALDGEAAYREWLDSQRRMVKTTSSDHSAT